MPADLPAASERLREQMAAQLTALLPGHLERLRWDRARLAAHQRDRLRELLAHAAANSPFHARRLAGIDVDRFEVADLPRLPVMTKAEMMSQFDHVITDRRLSLRNVQAHLDASKTRASLLLDEFVCLASGGSSGLRAAFVQTTGAYADFLASFISPGMARSAAGGAPPPGLVAAVVAAASPIHSSALAASVMSGPVRLVPVPATLPLGEITERLNALNPPMLIGYPTMLALLAAEQRAGRLRIAPAAVTASSEQLTDQDRAAITAAFGVPVTDQFASTEGLAGYSDPGGRVLTFATDTCIAELVDTGNQPVPPGTAADKVLVTNLHNLTQPLIRYELTDRFVRHQDDPSGRLRAAVDGRTDSVFRYGDVAVHPITFYSVLVGAAAITEFQVRQTRRGAVIDVVADGDMNQAALGDAIRHGLAQHGLRTPEVTIRAVPSIGRHAETGKVVRFVPSAGVTMTAGFPSRDAAGLREQLAGRVVLPGQDEYDAARQVWNASHDHRPAVIAQPLSAADVQAAIRFARDRDLPVSVRGGGHNHAGYAVADGALMLDLSAMVSVRVDPAGRVATVSGGATWGLVDHATQAAGLAVTGADVSPVGVGGATLGGGVGWLHRMHGLSGDNLLAAEIVTADGDVVSASASEHPELFWALRGGGGNFGAVTAFTFALHPVGPAHAATVICPMERAADALGLYQHLCESGGDELFLRAMLVTAPPAPSIPEQLRGQPAVVLSAAWFGPAGQAESVLRELCEVGTPAGDLPQLLSYVQLQRMHDAAVPRRVRATAGGGFTGPLTAGVIKALISAAAQPPPMSMVELQPLGGAVARISPDATPFRYRRAAHLLAVLAAAPPEDPGTEQSAWAQKVNGGLPAGTILGPSVHAMGRDEPEDRVRAAYGGTAYDRLAAVKHAYDPDNLFRFNQNIRPGSGASHSAVRR